MNAVAKDECRDFTEDEQKKWEKLDSEYEALGREGRLSDFDSRAAAELEAATSMPVHGSDGRMTQPVQCADYKDQRTGRAVCAIDAEHDARSAFRRMGLSDENEYRGLTIGRFCRAMVCGPQNEVERRALSEGTDSAGGFSVPAILLAETIDALVAQAQTLRAGAKILPVTSDSNTIIRVSAPPTATWHSENAAVTDNSPTFEGVTFTPRTLVSLVRASRELIEDSLNIEQALRDSFASALGAELDRVVLRGTGTAPEPGGITSFANVNSVDMGTNGLQLTNFDPFIDALDLIRRDNVIEPASAAIMHPRDFATLAKLKDANNQPLQRPSAIASLPFLQSTNIDIAETHGTAGNASRIFVGDFSSVLIGLRASLRIEILKERFADNYQFGFLAHLRADVQLRHPESLGMIVGVIP